MRLARASPIDAVRASGENQSQSTAEQCRADRCGGAAHVGGEIVRRSLAGVTDPTEGEEGRDLGGPVDAADAQAQPVGLARWLRMPVGDGIEAVVRTGSSR